MSTRPEPLYKSRPHIPSGARFGWCERVNDFITMSEGNSNSYLLETPEGHVLINTGMGFEAPVHHSNFSSLAGEIDGEIKYVVVTQGHVDHVGGVRYFRDRNPKLQLLATDKNEEHQTYDARLQPFRSARSAFRFIDSFQKLFGDYAKAGYTEINAQDRPRADITFESRYEFSLGGLDIVLIAQPGAETNDSLIVWLPQHKICLTGNLFGCPFGHFPNLVTIRGDRYREALVCAQAAQTVLDLKPEMILYGHHEPIVGEETIRREVTAIRDAIHFVHDATVKGMNEGKDVYTLQQEIQLPPELDVGEGYGKVSWGVRAIWESYAGWFHHQATSELYSTPQKSIHADLIALAGADAVLTRVQEKYDADEYEEALHLIEIVLSADAENEKAIELSLVIHRTLLEDAKTFRHTGQFWLEGWLEQRIKSLQGNSEKSLADIIR